MERTDREFVIIAHRGASAYEPENTIRSFSCALEMGADMIEFDVRLSRDGIPVVIHDKSVDRTTDGTGLVKDITLDDLKELNAGMGEKIPTLDEVLEFGTGKTKFVIELKENGTEQKVVDLIRRHRVFKDSYIVSFNKKRLERIKQLEPEIKTGLILLFSLVPMKRAKECSADAVAPFRWFIWKGLVEKAHRENMFFFTWIVDERDKALSFRKMGVDGIVTNKPDILG